MSTKEIPAPYAGYYDYIENLNQGLASVARTVLPKYRQLFEV